MKTLYLHIGTPKTGTTAIQCLCEENQELLKEKGYYYPIFPYQFFNVSNRRNGCFLYGRMRDRDGNRDIEAEQNAYQDCMKHVQKAFGKYDNIILSDEGLWTNGFREEKSVWERLKAQVDEGRFEVKVIVYLRPQEEFLYSWWSQRIKECVGREDKLEWKDMLKQLPTIKLDYYDMLQKIAKYIDKSNIIVRRFDRSQFLDGNIYSDFLNLIGLTFSKEYHLEKELQNESLTKNNTEIKRILNLIPDMEYAYHRQYREILLENSRRMKGKDVYSMFSATELEEFRQRYHEGNQKIAVEYMGIQGELFPLGNKTIEKWTPVNNYMLEDVVTFFGQVMIQMEKQLNEQQLELRKQQKQITRQQEQLDHFRYSFKHPMKSISTKVKNTVKK